MLQLIEGFVQEAAWLSDAETLTYLHSCISTRRHRVRVPEIPMYLVRVAWPQVPGMSAPRCAPRRRESSVEEGSTRIVVD